MVVSSVDARGRFPEVKVAGRRQEPLEATGSRVKMGNRSQLAATLRARCTDAWEYCYLPVVSCIDARRRFRGVDGRNRASRVIRRGRLQGSNEAIVEGPPQSALAAALVAPDFSRSS
jgi:hypothetical protein